MIKEITAKNQSSSTIEISKQALLHNLRVIKKTVEENVKIMAVVKANAYGHGDALVSSIIQETVDFLGVASVSEAVTLREKGIHQKILVFAPIQKGEVEIYSKENLTAVVGSFDELELITTDTEYHIEFDTGMGRLGFYPEDANEILQKLEQIKNFPSGLMTHFACADRPNSESVHNQIQKFETVVGLFRNVYPNIIIHASNSGGTLHYEYPFNMVRTGLAMYGYDPARKLNSLKPVLRWASKVIACKPIKKGMPVSYDSTWTTSEKGFLVIIPLGYADGIPRNLSNKISMYCNGKYLPQVGNITMDYTMLFSKTRVSISSEIEILGMNSSSPEEWATIISTIPYEILCGIHPKINRKEV